MKSAAPTFETIRVGTRKVACDGGGGALGHPRVFMTFGQETEITCNYCSRTYIYDPALDTGGDAH